jgi:hypothetical protein
MGKIMIKIDSEVKHLLSLASEAKKELGPIKQLNAYSPSDKIIFLLSHVSPEGAVEGATLLAKLCCLFDVLILGRREYLVIDNFGPEDINFARELSLSALNRFIHLQTINKKRHSILTPKGYSYFKENKMVKSPHLVTFLTELQEFSEKVDPNLINLAYLVVFHLDNLNKIKSFNNKVRDIPWLNFIHKYPVIYNSLIYNFYRYKQHYDFSKNPVASLIYQDAVYIPDKEFHLSQVKNSILDGDSMKDSQSSVFPYIEAISCFTSITGKLPSLLDIASIAFARINYYDAKIRSKGISDSERKLCKEKREAIISIAEGHFNKMEDKGFVTSRQVGNQVYYQNAARIFFNENLTFETLNKLDFETYNKKVSNYISKYRDDMSNIKNQNNNWQQKWLQFELDYFILDELLG